MGRAVGVMAAEHIVAGLVDDARIVSPLYTFPDAGSDVDQLGLLPVHQITGAIADLVARVAAGHGVDAVGLGFPGVIRGGMVEESPNLQQAKGSELGERLGAELVDALLRHGAHGHEPRALEVREVLRDLRLPQRELCADLAHRPRPVAQQLDDAEAVRLGEGGQRRDHEYTFP